MEFIIQILMLFIIINSVLKLSFWKLWQTAIFALVCSIFVIVMCQYAILQSKTQIADYLQNKTILQDAAVLITIESAICFAFCFAALREMFGKKIKRWIQPFYWYVSLLLFPVLFYTLTQVIFSMTGVDFSLISYLFAGLLLIAIPALSYFMKYLLPERELRLEVHFLVSLFVCILGLLTTVNGNVTYAVAEEPIHFKALFLSLGLFASLFLFGFIWNKAKWAMIQKKKLKESTKTNNLKK